MAFYRLRDDLFTREIPITGKFSFRKIYTFNRSIKLTNSINLMY